MALKTFKPYTKTTRGTILVSREGLWKGKPFKNLTSPNNSSKGRNNYGRITSRKSSVMRPVVSSVRDPSKGPGFVINVVVFFSGSGWEKT